VISLDPDSFSSGQIGSKLWLCEQLENCFDRIDTVWIYGGWYGLSAFLLRSRNNIKINQIRSFDMDPSCQPVADMINENWVYQNWKFKSLTQDCNTLVPTDVDLIINTSTEHFESMAWWENIPIGTAVALQGNDMPHDDHVVHCETLEDFKSQFTLSKMLFQGQLEFSYPAWKFNRYMIIGIK